MDTTTLPTVLVAVLTVVSPLITALFTHVQMDSTAKKNVAFGVSLVIAAIYVVATGGIHDLTNLAEIAGAAPIIFTLQQLIFGNLLKSVSDSIETKVGVKAPAPAVAVAPSISPVINVYPAAGGTDPVKIAEELRNRVTVG